MTTAYVPWSGSEFAEQSAENVLSQSPGTENILPRFRVHTRVLHELHRRLPTAADGDVVGSLSGRHVDAMPPDLPSTLFVDALVPVAVPTLGHGGGRVFVPVVKCQDTAVPAAMRSGRLKWRRMNARGVANAPGTVLFRLLHAVALCSLTGTGGWNGVSLVLTVELPRFSMWQVLVDGADGTGPLVSDVSLAIALAGGTPVHEGEDIGFLARPDDVRGHSRIVEPVHLAKADGREVVGVWALGGRERARLAAAVYVARTQSRRNLKLKRGKDRQRKETDAGVREVGFVLAHYSKERGGPPALFQCQARVEAREETFVASIADASGDEFADTLVADFRAASSIAEEENGALHGDAADIPVGHLQRVAAQVDALRAALEASTPREVGVETGAEGSVAEEEVHRVEPDQVTRRPEEVMRRNSALQGARVAAEFEDLPRALDVDFDAEHLGGGSEVGAGSSLGNHDVSDDENWARIQMLAEKYLGPDYNSGGL